MTNRPWLTGGVLFAIAIACVFGSMSWLLKTSPGSGEGELYAAPPAKSKAVAKVKPRAGDATSEKQMKAYSESIPGTTLKFDMVAIPSGKFLMGSPQDEPKRKDHEGPQVSVSLDAFWMGKTEVTWQMYDVWTFGLDIQRRELLKLKPHPNDKKADAVTRCTRPYTDMTFGMGHEGFPAICMTQLAAKYYCRWLSAKTGRYYRLPTEAEWEYACRAGTKTAYHFGNDIKKLGDYAWYFENSDFEYHPVGKKKPNQWGLHDMHGNVSEWVLDAYDAKAYETFKGKASNNPYKHPTKLYPRIVRGGSWEDDPDLLRSAARKGSNKNWKVQDPQLPQSVWYHTDAPGVGFRLVRPLKAPTKEQLKQWDPVLPKDARVFGMGKYDKNTLDKFRKDD